MRAAAVATLVLLAAALAAPARADLWAYIDENGKAHFATEPVDARYRLFHKGPTSLDLPPPAPPTPAAPQPTPLDAIKGQAIFKRLEAHPNVAKYQTLVARNARENGLDPFLVKAVIAVESAYQPTAVSEKGAVGLMQIMPATGERYGVIGDAKRSVSDKLKEPSINLRVGTRYLADLLERFDDDLRLALAAYNAGEGAVDRYNGVPPYAETRDYVRLVAQIHAALKPPPPPAPPAPRAAPAKPGRVTIQKPAATAQASPSVAVR